MFGLSHNPKNMYFISSLVSKTAKQDDSSRILSRFARKSSGGLKSIYVTDLGKHEVRRYRQRETTGIVVAGGNGKGSGLDELNDPRYVCVDEEHSVDVSDFHNHRVTKWEKDAKQGIVVVGGQGEGKNLTQLNGPHGVRIDATGHVYAADFGNHRVQRFSLENNWIKITSFLTGATEGGRLKTIYQN